MNSAPQEIGFRARYAQRILEDYHDLKGVPTPGPVHPLVDRAKDIGTIGIIGAGAAGLYTAMILQDLGLPYEIIEARDKVGGRLFTHHFPGGQPEDYYDIGAMRFPNIPLMARTFDLWTHKPPRIDFPPGTVISYILDNDNNFSYANGIRASGSSSDPNPFQVPIPAPFNEKPYSHWIGLKIDPFKKLMKEDFDAGLIELLKYDNYSTRSYMQLDLGPDSPPYPNIVIDYLETMDQGTGMYDCALTETVLDSLDFDYGGDVDWHCILGGAEKIAKAMAATLERQPRFKSRVTSISSSPDGMSVGVLGETNNRTYSHVVCTMALGCMRFVDTDGCNFGWETNNAIRMLAYGASVKVGMRFTDRWWENLNVPQVGGVSSTDKPTRMIVYPSYGIGSDSASMICCYNWQQDSQLMAAMMQGKGSEAESLMVEQILKDVAQCNEGVTYKDLLGKLRDYHAFDWYDDEFTCGAFALFRPTQFAGLYKYVTQPAAGGLFHFAGEASSSNHAWVAGALNSAYRAVWEILKHEGRTDLEDKLKKNWGTVDELREDLVAKQVLLGRTAGKV